MAKQFSKKVEAATVPFQYALSTKAGCECVAHILQALSDRDPEVTIMSIDGIGAFDLISRNSMFEDLLRMEDGDQLLPFVRCFYGSPSTYLWEDEMGVTQHISQGEGRPPHALAVRIGAAWFPRCCARTQNLLVKEVGHGWSCWLLKWAADGAKKLPLSSLPWPRRVLSLSPFILQGRVHAALIRRWSAMLACSAARAFAVSLLDRRPVPVTGGVIPSVHEVLRDARFG